MGGPQQNPAQLLVAGRVDAIMGNGFQALNFVRENIPFLCVGAIFQKDPQILMTHEGNGINRFEDMRGRPILVGAAGRTTYWPFLRARFGFTDEQIRPYTFNIQPFLADKNLAQQGYPSSEPFAAMKAGTKANFYLFADAGYPPYGTTIVALQKTVKEKPDLVQRFVRASMEGWKSYLYGDPSPANALIKKDNPNMKDENIAYAIEQLRATKVLIGGDAATQGIGVMSDERWKATYDFMVKEKLLKPEVDLKKAYTLQFVKDLKIMP